MEKGLKPLEKFTPEFFLWKLLWNQAPHAWRSEWAIKSVVFGHFTIPL